MNLYVAAYVLLSFGVGKLNAIYLNNSLCSVFLIMFMVFSVAVSATDNDKDLDELRISIVEAKPWGWTEGRQQQGVLYDLAALVAQELDVKLDVRNGSVARVIRQISNAETDFIYFVDNPILANVADNLVQAGYYKLQLWQRADADWSFAEPLQNIRIATSILGTESMPLLANVNVDHVHSANLLVPMLAAGRTDAVLELNAVLEYSRIKGERRKDQFNSYTIAIIPGYFWVSKNTELSAQVIEKVRAAVIKVSSPETIQELTQRYLNE